MGNVNSSCGTISRVSVARFRTLLLMIILGLAGCSGGASSQSNGGQASGPPPPFQPRPFPGDYFMRMANWDGGSSVPDAVYDPMLKEVFASDPDVNAIEVYSTANGQYVGAISIPGPAGLSFSPDYSELVVGTITPYIYFADPNKLHVTSQIQIPASQLTPDQSGDTLMPVMPYAMADGSIFLGMGIAPQSSPSASLQVFHIVKHDPTNQSFKLEDPNASGVTATPARSGDGRYLILGGVNNSASAVFLYSISAQAYVATSGALQGLSTLVAANADGSQFATLEEMTAPGSPTPQVTFWSQTLSPENTYSNFPQPIMNARFIAVMEIISI